MPKTVMESAMLKDILVVLDDESDRAGDYALSLATLFGAHVTAIYARQEQPLRAFSVAETRYDLVLAARDEAFAKAALSLQTFRRAAHRAGIPVKTIAPGEDRDTTRDTIDYFARSFDLVVLGQSERDRAERTGGLIASVLSSAGRPVIAVPFVHRQPASFRRVVVAWDGSNAAARALGDGLPLLARASSITIVTVNNTSFEGLPRGADVVTHLARHGLPSTWHELPSDIDVGSALLSHLADTSADFMIMGGYGHTRWRERVMGGVTRSLLDCMTTPLLISH